MCECWHCKELCPALNWAKANMPKEHFDTFAELYDKWTHAEMELAGKYVGEDEPEDVHPANIPDPQCGETLWGTLSNVQKTEEGTKYTFTFSPEDKNGNS